jgi:hypothetical protein
MEVNVENEGAIINQRTKEPNTESLKLSLKYHRLTRMLNKDKKTGL